MKISVIDIGSNSVRLATMADGKTLYKKISTTRLGEGLSLSGELSQAAIKRTALAVGEFKKLALSDGAQKIYVFATAAVRSANNKLYFLDCVKRVCGLDVDVISGTAEAEVGLLGVLKGADGGIIDVGGASCEITAKSNGATLYSASFNLGAVRLFDVAGRSREKLENAILGVLADATPFDASPYDMYAIGGTATTLASVKHSLKVYDPKITDGTRFSLEEVEAMSYKLLSLSVDEVKAIDGMDSRRADVIGGGALLLSRVMKKFRIDFITVSESDNLEGYYMLKEGQNEKL